MTFNKFVKIIPKIRISKFNPIEVDEKLIRSRALSCPNQLKKLKNSGVTQIIDLRCIPKEQTQVIPSIIERIFCKLLKIKYKSFEYSHKTENIPSNEFFEKINNEIRNNHGKTCIHCRHGKRRTGICVAIYEKIFTSKTDKEILDELYTLGFKDSINKNNKKVSNKARKKLINIYNNFIEKFYPNEPKIVNE